MNKEKNELTVLREELNKTGCGFCAAKWTQVTIHLQMGETHSCHHPRTHKIPVAELVRNPSALHNTKYKKERRKEMLEGKRPSECDYCWNVEDNSKEFSDRIYKSNEPWSKPHLEEIINSDWRKDYNPRYVEVAFSNVCNFKCSYCGPSFSSQWVQELKKHGAYPTSTKFNDLKWVEEQGRMPFNHGDPNPYLEAFWKWWPDLYRDLHTFRITGGEPLLAKDTWQVLDYIINEEKPNRNLNLGINSNLGVPDELIDQLIEKIQIIENDSKVKELVLYTSIDTWGNHADYIRNGMDYTRFKKNVEKILENCKRVSVVFMSTFNALSVFRYKEMLAFAYNLKKRFNSPVRYWNPVVMVDSSYLRHPAHQTVQLLPQEYKELILDAAKFCDELRYVNKVESEQWQPWHTGFTDIETDKIKRIADWMSAPQDPLILARNREDFYKFFTAHDKRRGTNFVETFPQLATFFNDCKDAMNEFNRTQG